jgi:hypothetical protein
MDQEKRNVVVLPMALGKAAHYVPYLPLGMLVAYLKVCQGGKLLERYDIEEIIPAGFGEYKLRDLYKRVVQSPNPVCLFSSYVWNHDLNIKAAAHVRSISPASLIIFGGPHVPKYEGDTEKFLRDNPFIDIAVLGEGEAALAEILSVFADEPRQKRDLNALSDVSGIVYSVGEQKTRTAERQRIPDINELPSPYLTGYCDWGSATLSKVTKFTPQRVIDEINYIAERKTEAIFIADANFGMLEQDIEIAQALVDAKARTGYPSRLFTNFAKNGGRRMMTAIKILHDGGLLPTGIIALQTTDPIVLKAIARDNIKTAAYEKMMTFFNAESIPMASDLMVGLPGQTIESFASDLQFCFDWKVSASANYTSMMPNAPMAERSYREQYGIVADDDDMILSTSSYTAADMDYMKLLFTAYQFHVRYGIGKYILYYLQVEHGVPAITFVRRWIACVRDNDPDLPLSVRVLNDVFYGRHHHDWGNVVWAENGDFLFDNLEAYCEEILGFAVREFDVTLTSSEMETLVSAQQAVIPRTNREYPYEISLQHDIVSYIARIKEVPCVTQLENDTTRLSGLSQGKLTVDADSDFLENTYYLKSASHNDDWELASPLRFY